VPPARAQLPRRPPPAEPAGPGTGKYAVKGQWAKTALRFVPDGSTVGPADIVRGEPMTGGAHLKPGYLSTEDGGRFWSFGRRTPGFRNTNPGPGAYNTERRGGKQMHATWGPPPRPYTCPAQIGPAPGSLYPAPTRLGPLMHARLPDKRDNGVPAPHDYQPGALFPPLPRRATTFQGRRAQPVSDVPGPQYHPECLNCTTLGAATANIHCIIHGRRH